MIYQLASCWASQQICASLWPFFPNIIFYLTLTMTFYCAAMCLPLAGYLLFPLLPLLSSSLMTFPVKTYLWGAMHINGYHEWAPGSCLALYFKLMPWSSCLLCSHLPMLHLWMKQPLWFGGGGRCVVMGDRCVDMVCVVVRALDDLYMGVHILRCRSFQVWHLGLQHML